MEERFNWEPVRRLKVCRAIRKVGASQIKCYLMTSCEGPLRLQDSAFHIWNSLFLTWQVSIAVLSLNIVAITFVDPI